MINIPILKGGCGGTIWGIGILKKYDVSPLRGALRGIEFRRNEI
jgi:hypothetical protein